MQNPSEIAMHLLIKTGNALIENNFELFLSCFNVPQSLTTQMGVRVLMNDADLRETFNRVRWYHRTLGATHLERECVSSMYLDDNTILSVHENRIMRNTQELERPCRALSRLSKTDGVWRISGCDYAIYSNLNITRALYGPQLPNRCTSFWEDLDPGSNSPESQT